MCKPAPVTKGQIALQLAVDLGLITADEAYRIPQPGWDLEKFLDEIKERFRDMVIQKQNSKEKKA